MNIFMMSDEEFEDYLKKEIDDGDINVLIEDLKKAGFEIKNINDNENLIDIIKGTKGLLNTIGILEDKIASYEQSEENLEKKINDIFELSRNIAKLMASKIRELQTRIEELDENEECFITHPFKEIDGCVEMGGCENCIIRYFIEKAMTKNNEDMWQM